jgi:P4 family phage/plasmid primase-like protien
MNAAPLNEMRELLGQDVVLIPVQRGQKCPHLKGWQNITLEKMSDPVYLKSLSRGNIGVLLGKPSNGLCSIDIDEDNEIEPFLNLNPQFKESLRTRGARGGNVWVKILGDYPPLTPLIHDAENGSDEHPKKWGEWRSTGGQTVIFGAHPSGCDYKIVQKSKPVEIAFNAIVWPECLKLPWDFGLYAELVNKQGQPFYKTSKGLIQLNDNFFAEKFALENAILHEPDECTFYDYNPARGLFLPVTPDIIKCRIADSLKKYADSQGESQIVRKRSNGYLNGLTDLLKGRVEQKDCFCQCKNAIHLANGMLHLEVSPPELREFSPRYHSRNQSPVKLVEGADCPRFKNELLAQALAPEDISLLQRWSGSLLLTGNLAHKIMLLRGTAGGGKSTLCEILERIVGTENVVELRTEFLGERFELYRCIGKTLLTGKDVPAEFLMRKGASILKKLVAHDLLSAEGKNKNEDFQIKGTFDVVITCNSQLRVRLEGDVDAWRRRLMIIDYNLPKVENRISDFASVLLKEESSGILLWMIEGARMHLDELKECGDYVFSEKQKERVEVLLAESDSVREFVRTCVRPARREQEITVEQLVLAYQTFCTHNDWHPVAPATVERQLPDLISTIHGVHKRNDIKSDEGARRGFKGIECEVS